MPIRRIHRIALLASQRVAPALIAGTDMLLLSGDMTGGTDRLILSGDMQSGTDKLLLSGT